MAAEWIAPSATAVVGVAGIVGTAYSTRAQRRTQLEIAVAQQTRQDRVDALTQKRNAFIDFLDRYHAVVDGARRLSTRAPEEPAGRDDALREIQQRLAALETARHRLWLSSSIYTIYYADEMLGYAMTLVQTIAEGRPANEDVLPAEHKVYQLMRMELAEVDLSERDPEELAIELQEQLDMTSRSGIAFAQRTRTFEASATE